MEFYDIAKVLPDGLRKSSATAGMVERINTFFVKEAEMEDQEKTRLEIHRDRKSDGYMVIVDDIYGYLHSIKPEYGAPLEVAVKYFLNNEEKSKTSLEDGHIPISNNICERAINPSPS